MIPSKHPWAFAWECSHCGARARVSHPFREGHWTDDSGSTVHPNFVRCEGCGTFELCEHLRILDFEGGGLEPTEEDYLAALATNPTLTREAELRLRTECWQASNDLERGSERAQIRSLAAQENVEALYELLDETDLNEASLKIEVARSLGRFLECVEIYASLPRGERARPNMRQIHELALERKSRVAEVEEPHPERQNFTCTHCGKPGVWRYVDNFFCRVPPERPRRVQAAKCGHCAKLVWYGNAPRKRSRVELQSDLGCSGVLLLFLAIPLLPIYPPAALVPVTIAAICLLLATAISRRYRLTKPLSEEEALAAIGTEDCVGHFEEEWLRSWASTLRIERRVANPEESVPWEAESRANMERVLDACEDPMQAFKLAWWERDHERAYRAVQRIPPERERELELWLRYVEHA